jgi:hypothetical protein
MTVCTRSVGRVETAELSLHLISLSRLTDFLQSSLSHLLHVSNLNV